MLFLGRAALRRFMRVFLMSAMLRPSTSSEFFRIVSQYRVALRVSSLAAGILPRAHLLQTADLHPDPFVQTVKNQFVAQFVPACPCFLLNKMVLLFYHRWVIVV